MNAKKQSNKLTEKQLHLLSHVHSLEDLNHVISIIPSSEHDLLLSSLKKNKHILSDNALKEVISASKDPYSLNKLLSESLSTKLKEEYDDLYYAISNIRKKGKDTFLLDLDMMSVPLKIKMFKSTFSEKDYYKAKRLIETIKKNLNPL
jgi:hypothetical protein